MISNKEMEDNMKIVKYLQENDLLIEDVGETIENEVKEQKGRFLSFLLVTLKTSLLGNLFSNKVGRQQVKEEELSKLLLE